MGQTIFSNYRKKQMEEQSMSAPLFLPINQAAVQTLRNQAITFQTSCSLQPQASTNHALKLIGNTLLLEHPNGFLLYLEITFNAKFEILYQTEKNVHSPKLGIRFYDDDERGLRVFIDSSTTEQWVRILGKRMNQKGFHEMFKPTRKLGKGNFATVYEAERLTDHAKFAVKAFIKQNCFSTKNGKQSLINQLTILRQLNKSPTPNILKLEGVFQSDNSIYVVLELLTGKTLFHAIEDRSGYFTQREIKVVVSGILKGLSHMHGHRIMHRDLKPENIMLRGDTFEPVIVDFGLATNADVNQYLFFRCGTPGYVAPEILNLTQSEHVEPACDVFSLGAVFHILLCRKPLFAGTKYDEVYQNNRQFNIRLEGDHFAGISNSARELLRKMLTLDHKSRISAFEALNHLYFFEQDTEESVDLKISSPVLTDIGNYKEPQIKRMGLLFY